jgi:hypothetical protein
MIRSFPVEVDSTFALVHLSFTDHLPSLRWITSPTQKQGHQASLRDLLHIMEPLNIEIGGTRQLNYPQFELN